MQSVTGNTLPASLASKIVEEEVAKPPGFEELLSDYGRLLRSEEEAGTETADNPGGHNPLWSIRTAEGIRVIREERRKVRRELNKRRDGEIEALIRGLTGGKA